MPDVPPKAEDSALALERERLDLEKQRLAFDQRFVNRNFSVVLASIIGIFLTIGQVWVEKSRAEREMKMAATEQDRQWKLQLAQFVVENHESLFSEDEKVSRRIRNVLLFSFPPDVAQLFIDRSEALSISSSFRRVRIDLQSGLLRILMFEGGRLSAAEVRELEAKIRQAPGDVEARARLLGYYRSWDQLEQRRPHLRWLIEKSPDNVLLAVGLPYNGMLPGKCDQELRGLWIKQIETRRSDPSVLFNAARFFQACRDFSRAEDLLRSAQALDPEDARYSQDLGRLLMSAGKKREAFDEFEAVLKRGGSGEENLRALQDVAKAAIEAGNYVKAAAYATQLLREAAHFEEDYWDYGNAIHAGNIVLGRVALRKGNIDEAKDYLLRAGATPGSPQLDSFGPNMSLARELLMKGEREVVIRYLVLCGKFWASGSLKEWQSEINEGRIPDFGGT